MLAVIRLLILALFFVMSTIAMMLFCIIRPFHRNNVYHVAKLYGSMHKLFGVELEVRKHPSIKSDEQYVYIANHQNNYDLFTISAAVQPRTVSIGKKSLKWVPFFGWIYWLSGNILIDRNNRSRAAGTISQAANKIKDNKLSIWMFPEGTRSYGKGLLPFKTGAFHTAVQADVAMVPVCMNSTCKRISLNKWNNGKVIVEMLEPIKLPNNAKENIREITNQTHALMHDKIKQLDAEVGIKE
ncbi:1-acylglycerol-3-phosphate O-acyltransferase [Flocculibacter collagenilyticus]|uniref:1-acylglycerol-3-phosphate O-acyltransferase n=1 Tax=Flocculibacter collagenilyticus TaxID=2744479 RepID=UPI0018F4430D|nr:1-acylglycerol-3-phosphate O-acyltransferase [Flocculibacter collagenilyticus]